MKIHIKRETEEERRTSGAKRRGEAETSRQVRRNTFRKSSVFITCFVGRLVRITITAYNGGVLGHWSKPIMNKWNNYPLIAHRLDASLTISWFFPFSFIGCSLSLLFRDNCYRIFLPCHTEYMCDDHYNITIWAGWHLIVYWDNEK